MSRAFIRESDDLPERPALARRASPLPPGAQNYITPDGKRIYFNVSSGEWTQLHVAEAANGSR